MISVIVPVYNVEKYLQKCLNSISNQTFNDIEVILVDDGSSDASGVICDEYVKKDKRFKVIHRPNGGLSAARNTGITAAQGEYISFVDSDDWVRKEMLDELIKILDEQQADLSECGFFLDENVTVYEKEEIRCYSKKEYMMDLLTDKIPSYFWGKLFKREVFHNQFFPEGKTFEDLLFMPQIIQNTSKIAVTNQKYYFYFQSRSDNITNHVGNRIKNQTAVAEAFRLRYKIAHNDYKEVEDAVLNRATISSMYAFSLLGNQKEMNDELKKESRACYKFIKESYCEIKKNKTMSIWFKVSSLLMLHRPKLFCKVVGVFVKD